MKKKLSKSEIYPEAKIPAKKEISDTDIGELPKKGKDTASSQEPKTEKKETAEGKKVALKPEVQEKATKEHIQPKTERVSGAPEPIPPTVEQPAGVKGEVPESQSPLAKEKGRQASAGKY